MNDWYSYSSQLKGSSSAPKVNHIWNLSQLNHRKRPPFTAPICQNATSVFHPKTLLTLTQANLSLLRNFRVPKLKFTRTAQNSIYRLTQGSSTLYYCLKALCKVRKRLEKVRLSFYYFWLSFRSRTHQRRHLGLTIQNPESRSYYMLRSFY